jgi:hypothetical protein
MFTIFQKSIYPRILFAVAFFLFCTASGSVEPKLPIGLVWLQILSPSPDICLGESAPILVAVYDHALGIPVGSLTVGLSSKLGASDMQITIGGAGTYLKYQPQRAGDDEIKIYVDTSFSGSSSITIPARVTQCGWHWSLYYSGTFPNPKGFWTFFEKASVIHGTLKTSDLLGSRKESKLEGEGEMKVSVDMNGTNPQMSCALNNVPEATDNVQVTGTLNQPGPGSMTISLQFNPVSLPGGSKFQCQVLGQRTEVPLAFPSATIDLNALGLTDMVLSTATRLSHYSKTISTAIVWQLPGSGDLTFDLYSDAAESP